MIRAFAIASLTFATTTLLILAGSAMDSPAPHTAGETAQSAVVNVIAG